MQRVKYEGLHFNELDVEEGSFDMIVEDSRLYMRFTNFSGVVQVLPDHILESPPGRASTASRVGKTSILNTIRKRVLVAATQEPVEGNSVSEHSTAVPHHQNSIMELGISDMEEEEDEMNQIPSDMNHSPLATPLEPVLNQERQRYEHMDGFQTPDWINQAASPTQSPLPPPKSAGSDVDVGSQNKKRVRIEKDTMRREEDEECLTPPMSKPKDKMKKKKRRHETIAETSSVRQDKPTNTTPESTKATEPSCPNLSSERALIPHPSPTPAETPALTFTKPLPRVNLTFTMKWERIATPNAPLARWGHGSAFLESHNTVVVLGGQDDEFCHLFDTFSLDLGTLQWNRLKDCDRPHAWFGCTAISPNDVLVIGGSHNDGRPKPIPEKQGAMLILDHKYNVWIRATCAGEKLKPVLGIQAVRLDSERVVVFGGQLIRNFSDTTAVLNTRTWEWSYPVITGPRPDKRVYYGLCTVGNTVVLFGGNNDKRSFRSVWCLDTDTWSWCKVRTRGVSPTYRCGVQLVQVGPTHILLHGGSDEDENGDLKIFSDSYILDLVSSEWKRVEEEGVVPTARSGHTLVPTRENRFVSFGGRTSNGVTNDCFKLTVVTT